VNLDYKDKTIGQILWNIIMDIPSKPGNKESPLTNLGGKAAAILSHFTPANETRLALSSKHL
jgi:hypothetical protein